MKLLGFANKNFLQKLCGDMEKQQLVSKIIKISISILFVVFFVILLGQYITMAQLNAKQSKLDGELNSKTEQYQTLNNEYEQISQNYEDYVTDYARDNFDYVAEDEILINK